MTELLDDLAAACAAARDRVGPGQWTAPTPCEEWDVRALTGHLVGMDLLLTAMFTDAPAPSGDPLGDDPAAAFRRSSAALQAAAARPGVLDRVQTTPVGTTTGLERLRWRVADLITHCWDLARATGAAVDVPDDVVERALAFAQAELPGQQRGSRFASPRPVASGAPALDRLAAFTGRTVPPSA